MATTTTSLRWVLEELEDGGWVSKSVCLSKTQLAPPINRLIPISYSYKLPTPEEQNGTERRHSMGGGVGRWVLVPA